MDEHGQHLHDIVGPYDEGSTLTFICEVDGGDDSDAKGNNEGGNNRQQQGLAPEGKKALLSSVVKVLMFLELMHLP
ncbi:hypothetical protein TNIN_409761 [Trichonephila inaurata madagascariensis]|uniref:Uncharacterized protein n=1 Tax=Trichonephila inaurata madagascariensis TaxID=2747483 RepID=A0A8X6JCY0_9ARAC|nr:hypothetical protein TNIN_409761 [Trichonephila inaurata madagascariensis]